MAPWADTTENVLYRWGGEIGNGGTFGSDDAALWKFTPDSNGTGEWSRGDVSDNGFGDILQAANGTAVTCGQKAFYLGGYGSSSTDYRLEDLKKDSGVPPLPGLVTYDMGTGDWSNETAITASSPNGAYINGQAVCGSGFSDEGIIVLLGGKSTSLSNVDEEVEMSSMRNISFFDVTDQTWHWQTARGEVPRPREFHCAVGVHGQDSTYEIFMYGGNNPSDGVLNDVYILSLPAFEWFRAEVESPPRVFHDCVVVGKRQMLSHGGLADVTDWRTSDEWPGGVGIFDMTELTWAEEYDAAAADYQSPHIVKDWYDNGGMSTVTWDTDKGGRLFGNEPTLDEWGETEIISVDDGYTEDDDLETSKKTPVGAIAGGVVGGVAGIAVLGAAFWFWRRRKQQQQQQQQQHEQQRLQQEEDDKPPYSSGLDDQSLPAEMPGNTGPQHAELPDHTVKRYEMQG